MFHFFIALFVIFLNFLQRNLPNVLTAHCILGDTNFKHEKSRVCKGSVLDFCKFLSLTDAKNGLQISLKVEPRLKENIFYQSAIFYRISPKKMCENALSVLLLVLMLTP